MERVKKALEALDDPKNEPIKWLLGAALKQHAEVTRGLHFLLDALARTPRPSMLVSWNVYIHQVRELLANPETAPQKALLDLKSGPTDAEGKLLSFMAEIQAPLHLKKLGYEEFRILLPSTDATPDFDAKFERREARIEVKNLQEPTDIVRTVAANHWRTLQDRNPGRYNFRVVLKHQHRGQLSLAARKRLRSILDVLPETKKKIEEVLDGNVRISIEKLPDPPPERSGIEDVILSNVLDKGKEGQMVIASGITAAHLTVDVAEVQSLFVKAIKPTIASMSKFFGEDINPDITNVVAMRWEPPEFMFDPGMLEYVEQKIGELFESFQLPLKPVIFVDPEMPWELIRKYRDPEYLQQLKALLINEKKEPAE